MSQFRIQEDLDKYVEGLHRQSWDGLLWLLRVQASLRGLYEYTNDREHEQDAYEREELIVQEINQRIIRLEQDGSRGWKG